MLFLYIPVLKDPEYVAVHESSRTSTPKGLTQVEYGSNLITDKMRSNLSHRQITMQSYNLLQKYCETLSHACIIFLAACTLAVLLGPYQCSCATCTMSKTVDNNLLLRK